MPWFCIYLMAPCCPRRLSSSIQNTRYVLGPIIPKRSHKDNKRCHLISIWSLSVYLSHSHIHRAIFKNELILQYMSVCLHVSVHYVHVNTKARRGRKKPWNWSYRRLWAAIWVLGIDPGSSGKATSSLLSHLFSPQQYILKNGKEEQEEEEEEKKGIIQEKTEPRICASRMLGSLSVRESIPCPRRWG